MSEEMLPGKLSRNGDASEESTILVVEEEKEKKKGLGGGRGILLFLMVGGGLGAVALTSITLLAPVIFYDHADNNNNNNISGSSISSNIDNSPAKSTALTTTTTTIAAAAAASSVKAIDGKGTVIENNGLTESDEITISEYFDGTYSSTKLRCSIDSLPAYCNGSPVTFQNLPIGTHKFTIVHASNEEEESIPLVFSWKNITSK